MTLQTPSPPEQTSISVKRYEAAITPLMLPINKVDRSLDVTGVPQPASSPADDVLDALSSNAPAPHAYKPESSQYPHGPAASARFSDPRHAPPCASRSYAA